MNREDVIRMAREAGAGMSTSAMPLEHPWVFLPDELERFAALVAAAEREACAKVCEEDAFVDQWKGLAEAVKRIRARGQA